MKLLKHAYELAGCQTHHKDYATVMGLKALIASSNGYIVISEICSSYSSPAPFGMCNELGRLVGFQCGFDHCAKAAARNGERLFLAQQSISEDSKAVLT